MSSLAKLDSNMKKTRLPSSVQSNRNSTRTVMPKTQTGSKYSKNPAWNRALHPTNKPWKSVSGSFTTSNWLVRSTISRKRKKSTGSGSSCKQDTCFETSSLTTCPPMKKLR